MTNETSMPGITQRLKAAFSSARERVGVGSISGPNKNNDIYKAVIPNFLYKPPYGYPRFVDIPEIRRLAATPFVNMVINTIVNEIAAVEWDIVPKDGSEVSDSEIKRIKDFFNDPNNTKENFDEMIRKVVVDMLTIDSGVFVKVFNLKREFSQLYVRDGGTFTKNPDIYGTFENRAEFVFIDEWNTMDKEELETYFQDRPAYFQYGWSTGARPMPFGTREIVYMMLNPQPDSIYGRSPMEALLTTVQMLVYGIEHNLEYFTDNNIPKGIIEAVGMNSQDIKDFKQQWKDQQRIKDENGNWRNRWYNMPMLGTKANFHRLQFSNAELELIGQQKWFSKLVWACFGVTPSELGFTEDSNKSTEIIQSRVFRRKAIRPILKSLEFHINAEIVWQEFNEDAAFQFDTYDLEEDIHRHTLFEMQLRNGIRTVNEVREDMGLETVEGGDDIRKTTGSMFNPFDEDKKKLKITEEDNMDPDKKPPEDKAMNTTMSIIPGPFERITEVKLEKILIKLLKLKKKNVDNVVESMNMPNKLSEIKSELSDKFEGEIDLSEASEVVNKAIQEQFLTGVEDAGKQLNMNFVPDRRAIKFLQDHALENIKDMSEEIKNDIRAELERGMINGEGIPQMKARVNKIFKAGIVRATAIARTETNRASNMGHLDGYKQGGVEKKKWVAAMDNRTSSICRRLNGKTVGINEDFDDSITGWEGKVPPAHVNCLLKDTNIRTKTGIKKVQDIQIGDNVLTHNNRYREVTGTMNNESDFYYEVEVGTGKNKKKLKITGDHPVLTNNGWKLVKDLEINDFVMAMK